jgi:hypothetical protein
MKVKAITNLGPGIKVHMLEEPRRNLRDSGGTSEEPKTQNEKPHCNLTFQHIIRLV